MNKLTEEQDKRFEAEFGDLAILGKTFKSYSGAFAKEAKIANGKRFIADEIARAKEEGRKEEENRWLNQSANEHDKRIKREAVEDFVAHAKIKEKMTNKLEQDWLKFLCNKCGKEQRPDKKQSNKNWEVFPNVPCSCGGEFELKIKEELNNE